MTAYCAVVKAAFLGFADPPLDVVHLIVAPVDVAGDLSPTTSGPGGVPDCFPESRSVTQVTGP